MVEEISLDFLKTILNNDAIPYTDDLNGFIKKQSIIFDEIESNGMRDPILIVISKKYKTIRLEAGNHRVPEAISRGYTHLPAATFIIEEKLLKEGNGVHCFCAKEIIDFEDLLETVYPYQQKLSDCLKIKI